MMAVVPAGRYSSYGELAPRRQGVYSWDRHPTRSVYSYTCTYSSHQSLLRNGTLPFPRPASRVSQVTCFHQ